MDSQAHLSPRQQLFVISCVVLGCVLLSASVGSSGQKAAQRVNLPIVKSQSQSLQFIDTGKADFGLIIRMLNTSQKSITAYTVSLCDIPLFAQDYSIGNDAIAPGETVEIKVSTQAVSNKCGATTLPTITILAVVFDDRTTEGEFRWAKGILDNRRGEKIQLKRINRLLRQAAKWENADKLSALERLKSEIAALPVDQGQPLAVRGGLATAKDRTLHMIAELEQWHSKNLGIQSKSNRNTSLRAELAGATNLREAFSKLISLNEKWISKY